LGAKFSILLTRPVFQDFDWRVIGFASGIAAYFALPFEPGMAVLSGLIALISTFVIIFKNRSIEPVFMTLLVVLVGTGWARLHTYAEAAPILPKFEKTYEVTGWVAAIEKSGNGRRLQLAVTNISGLDPASTPKFVRVRANTVGISVGDGVRLRAMLSSPPGPVVPGGYDPARRAFFQQTGGYGFAMSKVQRHEVDTPRLRDRWVRGLSRYRHELAHHIMSRSPEKTAGLQAALLTGIRTYIPQDQTDALRVAGLAHVLAISGLHMGLLAGGAYYLASLCFALILPLSRRYDMRKPAAVAGAIAATYYLALSGGSVATQRAYIMAIIVFAAIILNRRAFSMRSVSVAALLTLILHPESLISVGFQMSFAAVAALVLVYDEWRRRSHFQPGQVIRRRIWTGFATLSVTSFVAGTATSGFAVLHFNRIARYGLLGNLLAMPIFTFLVMPLGFFAMVTMPLGLDRLPLQLMGTSLSVLLAVAEWVAGLKGSMWYVPAAPAWVIGLFGLAYAWICLGPSVRRKAGLALVALCLLAWQLKPTADMRISDNGEIAFWDKNGANQLYVSGIKSDRYGREQFAQMAGQYAPGLKDYKSGFAKCDTGACRFEINGYWVSVVEHPSEVAIECANADLVVLVRREAGPVARRGCDALLIDKRRFHSDGSIDVYFETETIRTVSSSTLARKKRPWGRRQ